MADDDKAQKQPKDTPAAQEQPQRATPNATEVPGQDKKAAATPATQAAAQAQVARETTALRCPHCNRLSEWDDAYLAANHGQRVGCPLCSETMALP